MSDSENVQVFILAENCLLCEALTRILGKENDIRVVGASAFSPDVVEQISSAAPDVLLSDSAVVELSDLRLVSEVRAAIPGLKVVTNKEIASQLNLSEQTVKNHIHRMLRKLGAADRLGAVELCRMPGAVA
jgi:DNA-binding NarL/FixJ family response regulator